MDGYKHYIRVDSNNVVIYRFSDAFEQPQTGDICVATNAGRHYNDPITDSEGLYLYKWDGTQIVARTDDEIHPLSYWQNKKIAELQAAFLAALFAGFTSSADGTARTYGFAPSDQENFEQQTAAMNAGIAVWPADWAEISGNTVSLDQTQFIQLDKDAQAAKWTKVQNWRTKKAAAIAATTKDAVNAVTW